MMGQDRQASARGIAIASATPPYGIAWLGGEHRQLDVLIAEHSGAAIDRAEYRRVHVKVDVARVTKTLPA